MNLKFVILAIIGFHSFVLGDQSNYPPIKWPEIDSEFSVDVYHDSLLTTAREYFNTSALPMEARQDGIDILTRLDENLNECRDTLNTYHKLWLYKACVHEKLETTANEIWTLRDEMEDALDDFNDDDPSAANLLTPLTFFILLSLTFSFFI